MSTLNNEKQFNFCKKHIYRQKTEWSAFDRKDHYYERIRKRWSECRICSKRNFLMPKERETFGLRDFSGRIEDFLSEEQMEVAHVILSTLYKGNNNKRWPILKRKLLNKFLFERLDETLECLHGYGILIFREEREGLKWMTKQIRFNKTFEKDIRYFVGVKDEVLPEWMTQPFPPLKKSSITELDKVYQFLLQQKNQYKRKGKAVIFDSANRVIVSSSLNPKGYFKLIRIIYGIYGNVQQKRKEYWKMFSQRIFGDTKAIKKVDKQRLERLFGKNFENYGILPERNEVVLSGDFAWSYKGYTNTSRAFKDYVVFQREMIHETRFTKWVSPSLLIIENPALFFSLVKSCLLDIEKCSILLGNGFVSSYEVEIVKQACKLQTKRVFIWPDLDPYGYQIAYDIAAKLKKFKISVYLFGFTLEWFHKIGCYKSLDPYDFQIINQLLNQDTIHEEVKNVLVKMKNEGKKAEQENLFSHLQSIDLFSCLEQSLQLN